MKSRIGFLVHRSVPAQRLRDAFRLLDRMQVGYEVKVASAGLDPAGVGRWVETFTRSGGEILVAYEDESGGLAGLAAAHTMLPVVSAPILAGAGGRGGVPHAGPGRRGVPVAFLGGEHAADAALFSLRVLALADAGLRSRLEADHREEIERLEEQGHQLRRQLGEMGGAARKIGPPPASSRDEEMVEQFARSLKPRLKSEHGPQPGTAQPAALDYSLILREILGEARDLAVGRGEGLVGPVHFLAAIARMPQAAAHAALREAGADLARLRLALQEVIGPEGAQVSSPRSFGLDAAAEAMLARARVWAREAGRECLTTVDILLAIGEEEDPRITSVLADAGVDPDRLQEILFRPDVAEGECEELEASKKDRLPKAGTPPAMDHEAMERLRHRFYGGPRQGSGGAEEEPEVFDIGGKAPGRQEGEREKGGEPREEKGPKGPRLLTTDPQNPDLEAVEQISDALLDGGVIAMPTDTMVAFLADATNPAAVERLVQATGREPDRPITVLVHSTAVIRNLARTVPDRAEEMLDTLWPGPLTVVFDRHPQRFKALGQEPTISIRSPDHYLTLSVLSMLGRPVAAVAVPGGEEGSSPTPREIAGRWDGEVQLVVDAGEAPPRVRPTVLSVTGGKYRIVRSGPVSRETIEEALGEPVAES